MTWPRYLELCAYWDRVPPLAESVASLLGTRERAPESPPSSADAMTNLAEDFGVPLPAVWR